MPEKNPLAVVKNPLEIVWAVCTGIPHAGQMTRATLSTSAGWKEVDESHDKVRAALGLPNTPSKEE